MTWKAKKPEVTAELDWQQRWQAALRRIEQAGYGQDVHNAYKVAGPVLWRRVGPAAAVDLAGSISHVAIRSGRRAAALLSASAAEAAELLTKPKEFVSWLEMVEFAAKKSPACVPLLLERTSRLLRVLDCAAFIAYVRMGLSIAHADLQRGRAFFALASREGLTWLDRGDAVSLADRRPGLNAYLAALWGLNPPLVEVPADAPEHLRRRAGFGGGGIRLPASFAGFSADDQKDLYRATLAHIGAHYCFTRAAFPASGLQPLQIALTSLIEDARVERQAFAVMPGLRRLLGRFHVARADGMPTAIALMARLSRALIDEHYADPHGWVDKGRRLFEEAVAHDIADQQLSRRIGGILGNDIGQMRLQFDARSYVVQPAYRDDNLGLWDFGDEADQPPFEMDAVVGGAVMNRQEGEDGRSEQDSQTRQSAGRIRQSSGDEGLVSARYPEYDHMSGHFRPAWCTVREICTGIGSPAAIAVLRDTRSDLVERLSALMRSVSISRQERVKRQPDGEYLDVDAAIAAMVSRRAGEIPDTRVYGRYERRSRDISVLLMIDVSRSTNDPIRGTATSVLEVERLAASFMARAMESLGDPFAVAAFCSNTREDIRYNRIKDFDQPFDEDCIGRLAGLKGDFSTRLGPVIRHGGQELRRRSSYRRLLLIVTDGEPSDIDVDDKAYLVEDARTAVQELKRDGMDVFCVTLESVAASAAERIFGRKWSMAISSPDELPQRLPQVYLRLRS
ncbi:nitric oxide reductase activation protein NorD [Ancylobacter sp. IITR112]|uniref:nitric oxide reductase activation protein NorD n=1 Tax=Ancylobacter sp. IITR112 TaxID=3138073 RepID=UPI00352AB3D9